jgi:C1A family cysteine protease
MRIIIQLGRKVKLKKLVEHIQVLLIGDRRGYFVTPVKMQGYDCGSCWAFASTAVY